MTSKSSSKTSWNFFHLYIMLIPFKISLPLFFSFSPDTMIMKYIYDLWPSLPNKKDIVIAAYVIFQCIFLLFVRRQILVWIPSVLLQERLGSLRNFGISIFPSSSFFSSCFTYDLLLLIFLPLQCTVPWWGLDRATIKKKRKGIKGKGIPAFLFQKDWKWNHP